jgi:hypothetical protein
MVADAPPPTAADVLRVVLLRSELVAPLRVDPLVEALIQALREAGLQVTPMRPTIESTAQLDMLDRSRRHE